MPQATGEDSPAVYDMAAFTAPDARPTLRRKDFESTRAYARELNAVLVDHDKGLKLVVKQDTCQKVLAFAEGLGCDQAGRASDAL